MSARKGEMAALKVLQSVEQGAYFNIALAEALKGLNSAERAVAVACSKTVLENLIPVDWALSLVTDTRKCGSLIRNILRIGAARMLYLNTPAPQAASAAVDMCKSGPKRAQAGYVNAVMRSLASRINDIQWPNPEDKSLRALSLKYSWPEWVCEKIIGLLGIDAEKFFEYKFEPFVSLRVNKQKASREEILEILNNARPSELSNLGIRAYGLEDAAGLEIYKKGLVSIQGEASMLVSEIAACDGLVIDACAAPGGKACAIAENIKGKVIAADIHPHRVELIRAQAKRLGLSNVECIVNDAAKGFDEYQNMADCVLVDAPCTGFGTYKNRPDIKYKHSQDDIAALSKLQLDILRACSKAVKPGGRLVYSTCTFTKEENEDNVQKFLEENSDFALMPFSALGQAWNGMMRLWPHKNGTDAFFITVMERVK